MPAAAKFKPVRKIHVDLLPTAKCNDCAWTRGYSECSLAEAKLHVRDTGHEVVLERVSLSRYGPEATR